MKTYRVDFRRMTNIDLRNGDCLDVLKELDDNSIDSIVTDPPYGLSFMGKRWDYDVPSIDIWEECLRVLKPGGHLLSFSSARTYHRMVVNVEDAGFEIRDQIMWVYGSGFPKSHNIGKKVREYEGWGTALKPAHEPIVMARKPITEKTVADNVIEYGTGGINIDGCRVGTMENLSGGSGRVGGFAGKTQGGDVSEYRVEGNELGRFPANFIHDGSDEVLERFPETGSGNNKGSCVYNDREYNNKDNSMFNGDKPQAPSNFNDKGTAARFFYCPKANKKERNAGCEDISKKARSTANKMMGQSGEMKTGSGNDRTTEFHNNHPTVKPVELMKYLCRLITPKDGIVLDPFMGSGSTGIAAKLEGFSFVGIELDADYLEIAKARIDAHEPEIPF